MEKTIKASLAYIGRNVEWLAKRLGTTPSTIYRRFTDELWTLPQLREMKKIFGWQTLEG